MVDKRFEFLNDEDNARVETMINHISDYDVNSNEYLLLQVIFILEEHDRQSWHYSGEEN